MTTEPPRLPVSANWNYRDPVEQAVAAVRTAIEDALELIRNCEDGPFTMTVALRTIEERLDVVYSQMGLLNASREDLREIALKLRDQYEEAIQQRDAVIQALGLRGQTA